ncbi:DUF4926 domain-containing protein [Prochlorothrix hollandica]|uniref:DUF4926 domain-containing protein n=1 Tax=Prochlorothrix hollandica PCC 9006 = CALU 1027 TaxID=317619 RepID=A0A0M2PVC6_PROHO|nr:DUF4926 domain-containing protein [Prochlorothrix hollandica]KKJ00105.1 hypothetical protein PROH_10215 [Prochlorothrix hollandica PCC 9006 = CALU 1027]
MVLLISEPYALFSQAVLLQDVPEYGLKRGAIGTIVEHYPMPEGVADGYSVEGFGVVGVTIEVDELQILPVVGLVEEFGVIQRLRSLSREGRELLERYLEGLLWRERG